MNEKAISTVAGISIMVVILVLASGIILVGFMSDFGEREVSLGAVDVSDMEVRITDVGEAEEIVVRGNNGSEVFVGNSSGEGEYVPYLEAPVSVVGKSGRSESLLYKGELIGGKRIEIIDSYVKEKNVVFDVRASNKINSSNLRFNSLFRVSSVSGNESTSVLSGDRVRVMPGKVIRHRYSKSNLREELSKEIGNDVDSYEVRLNIVGEDKESFTVGG